MNAKKNIKFIAAIRGYHFYKRYWQQKEAEWLRCFHEVYNPFDVFAIKTVIPDKVITGHLPREISRDQVFAGQRSRCLRRANIDTLSNITNNARWSGNTVQNYRKTSWNC